MPQNLTPEQLAAIMAGYPTMDAADQARQGLFAGWGEGAFHLPEYRESANYITTGVGDGSSTQLGDPNRYIYRELSGKAADVWDPTTGQYIGQSTGMSDGQMAVLAALMAATAGYGIYASGAGATTAGAATTAGTTGTAGGTVALTPAEIAATNTAATVGTSGQVAATAPGYLGTAGTAATGTGLAGASTGGTQTGAAGYTTAAADSQAANVALGQSANSGSVPASVNLTNAGGTMATGAGSFMGLDYDTWARLAGAAMGAVSSGDQTQSSTQNREPWGPAQDWIKQNIASGQGLQQHYQQQPFNQQQQQAMNEKAGLLSALQTQAMPGLLSGLGQMSQGYQRKGGPAPRANAFNYDPQALLAAMQNYRG